MLAKMKSKKFIAVSLSLVITVTALAVGLVGAFALKNDDWVEFNKPDGSWTLELEYTGTNTAMWYVGGANELGWLTSDNSVANISYNASGLGTITPVSAGQATIVAGDKDGVTYIRNYLIYDNDNIVKYSFAGGRSANIKNVGGELDMNQLITALNGKGTSAYDTIVWESWGDECVEVSFDGKVTAVANGSAIIVGKTTDKWGTEQLIPYYVSVGKVSSSEELGEGVVKIGDDYYRPVTDTPNVWEKTDAEGTLSTGEYFGGNETLPNPFDPLYKIQPADDAQEPTASEFSETYPGYLTTKPEGSSEYDKWQRASNVDKSALQAAIDDANSQSSTGKDPALWSDMQNKLAIANTVNNDPDATQDEVDAAAAALRSALNALGVIAVGAEFVMGTDANGYDLEWQVLAIENGKALVITTTVAAECLFHATTPYPTWGNSNIRAYLKNTFYANNFTTTEKGKILLTNVVTKTSYNGTATETTEDYLFLLSSDEISKYLTTAASRLPKTTNMGNTSGKSSNSTSWGYNRYWLRDPKGGANHAAYIDNCGAICYYNVTYGKGLASTNRNQGGVRPAMWLDLSKF